MRALGSNAKAVAAFEATPGTIPNAKFFTVPFVSHSMGEQRPLIASDLLGLGREPQDPIPDVASNDGDVVVPVDVRNFGQWLKLTFGAPNTAAGPGGTNVHTFASGAASLPSLALEIGAPEVPSYSTSYGCRMNSLKIAMARSGLLNATASLIAIGETAPAAATVMPTPSSMVVQRFAQATGSVVKDGQALGSVVGAEFTFTNNLEKVETIKADGRIEDSDPGMVMMMGKLTVKFKDTVLLNAASSGTPCELDFGWTAGPYSLVFKVPRVFLPPAKRPIAGAKGIQIDFDWQASGASAASVTAVLTNDVASYA